MSFDADWPDEENEPEFAFLRPREVGELENYVLYEWPILKIGFFGRGKRRKGRERVYSYVLEGPESIETISGTVGCQEVGELWIFLISPTSGGNFEAGKESLDVDWREEANKTKTRALRRREVSFWTFFPFWVTSGGSFGNLKVYSDSDWRDEENEPNIEALGPREVGEIASYVLYERAFLEIWHFWRNLELETAGKGVFLCFEAFWID